VVISSNLTITCTNCYKGFGHWGSAGSVRNLMRGAKAVHVANRRAKVLKEQARVKAKSAELVKAVIGGDAAKSGQQGKGLVLMKLGRLRQKDLAVKKCNREAKHSRLAR
jgi:hypothetical protein